MHQKLQGTTKAVLTANSKLHHTYMKKQKEGFPGVSVAKKPPKRWFTYNWFLKMCFQPDENDMMIMKTNIY